jgi:cell division protein FtsB
MDVFLVVLVIIQTVLLGVADSELGQYRKERDALRAEVARLKGGKP